MIDKDKLNDALRQMGNDHLKCPFKERWTPEHPTTGYCYLVTKVLYYYCYPESQPYVVTMNGNEDHWFLKTKTCKIIDLTADQFDTTPPWNLGKPRNYKTKIISKSVKDLAKRLGFDKPIR